MAKANTSKSYEFKAETQRLLNLMIHSLYSHKEIFLRELISNASDALDRLRFEALTDENLRTADRDLAILLETDPGKRILTIHDTGIGMSRDEAVQNLGTIAHSGWLEIMDKMKAGNVDKLAPEFIGQFGVGFYSSFMVADRVTVLTRRAGEDAATLWQSSGDGTFQVEDAEKKDYGTSISLHLKPVDEDDGIGDFTSEWVLAGIVKKYSDFVPYPVKLEVFREVEEEKDSTKSASGERTIVREEKTLNSMRALWTRPQAEVSEQECQEFYRHIAHDWNEPMRTIRQHAEGRLQYDALLFIPGKAPKELFYKAYKGGLQLYVRNVKIIEGCTELMPNYLRFIRGVVDCADLPLNVSREMLQHAREIGQIQKALVKKVLDTLATMQASEPDCYLTFWKEFGRAIKEGVGSDSDNRDKITRLLMFQSSNHPADLTTLLDYVGRMKPEQTEIFYLTGESRAIVENHPALESFKDKGYEVLYLVEPVDELVVQYLHAFESKRLKSVGKGTIDLGSDEEKQEAKNERQELEKTYAEMLEAMQKKLDEHVKQVRLSSRLTTSPACLVGAEHDYSPQLEKLLLAGKGGGPKQRRILEINPRHPLLEMMYGCFVANKDDPLIGEYAELLLGQGLLSEGSALPDPIQFSQLLTTTMLRSLASQQHKR